MEDIIYWLGINSIPHLGPIRIQALLKKFGNPKEIFNASPNSIKEIGYIKSIAIKNIQEGIDKESIIKQIKLCEKNNIKILTLDSDKYPRLLKNIIDPPPVLFVKGDINVLDSFAIGVVGTRNATSYGRLSTKNIVSELAKNNITIISGMARGIDTISHKTAIENNAKTIAVLGCGLNICYPPENKDLMEQISLNGAVVSEFSPDTRPNTFTFPRRNRIISGLSEGILVTEAGLKSGALITTDFALEHGRDVFSIPGQINAPNHKGCNKIIQEGAALITSGKDILELLKKPYKTETYNRPKLNLNEKEEMVYNNMGEEPIHIDILSQNCNSTPSKILGVLLGLELKGAIQQLSGKNFVKT